MNWEKAHHLPPLHTPKCIQFPSSCGFLSKAVWLVRVLGPPGNMAACLPSECFQNIQHSCGRQALASFLETAHSPGWGLLLPPLTSQPSFLATTGMPTSQCCLLPTRGKSAPPTCHPNSQLSPLFKWATRPGTPCPTQRLGPGADPCRRTQIGVMCRVLPQSRGGRCAPCRPHFWCSQWSLRGGAAR